MSWLLSKVTGGLIGGGSAKAAAQKTSRDDEDDREVDEEDENKEEEDASDCPIDYSTLSFPSHDELCRASITFSRWSPDAPLSIKSRHALLLLLRVRDTFDSELRVYLTADKPALVQPLTGALWFEVRRHEHALLFSVVQGAQRLVFHCRFHDAKEETAVALQWSVAVWEHAQQDSFTKSVKQEAWVNPMMEEHHEPSSSYTPSATEELTFMEDDDDAAASSRDGDDKEDEEEDEEPEVVARQATPIRGFKTTRPRALRSATRSSGGANDKLAVGIAVNKAFVGRGDVIGVFNHDERGQLNFQTSIGSLHDTHGRTLLPSQMLLHENDRKMILVDGANKAYEMDIERGVVVQEFKPMAGADFAVRSVGHASKYAERTDEALVLGVNKNTVFSLDSRAHGAVAHKHQYATPLGMNSVVASGSGAVATGSEKGEIRLYNDINKVAKTRLPGLGDAIIGLDTTEDGRWILATTRYYLLLISTAIAGDSKDGWSKSMTASAAPPIKLQLSPADMLKYNITALSFTTAHFNTGEGADVEEWIITSAGPYIVTWNFRKIRIDPTKYKYVYDIKRLTQDVVADQFLYNHKDAVVVTTANNVFTERKGKRL